MHRKIILNCLFIALFYTPGIVQAKCQTLKVITYNIYHGEENYNRDHSNLSRIAEIIKLLKPDIVLLQEVDSMTGRSAKLNNGIPQDQAAELARLTGMKGYFGKAIDYDGGGYGEGMLLKNPALVQVIKLPTPKGGEGRALMKVLIEKKGRRIIIGGTHLCHQFEQNRVAQIQEIIYVLDSNLPVLLAGDLNFEPLSPPYRLITARFSDAAVIYGKPENTYSVKEPKSRIDYFFLYNPYRWKIKKLKRINDDPSDHFGLFIKVKINRGEEMQ